MLTLAPSTPWKWLNNCSRNKAYKAEAHEQSKNEWQDNMKGTDKANGQVITGLPDSRKENSRPGMVKNHEETILALRTNLCPTPKLWKSLAPVPLQMEIRTQP